MSQVSGSRSIADRVSDGFLTGAPPGGWPSARSGPSGGTTSPTKEIMIGTSTFAVSDRIRTEASSGRDVSDILKRVKTGVPGAPGAVRSATIDGMLHEEDLAKREHWFRRFVKSQKFDVLSAIVIVINSILLGVEQEFGDRYGIIAHMEHLFLVCYTTEVLCRLYAYRRKVLLKSWWWFDVVLVMLGIMTGWILTPLLGAGDESSDIQVLMVLRATRLLRLARVVQVSRKLRVLGLLVKGLLTSMKTIFYTLFLLFIVLYMASCISMEIITQHHLATGPRARDSFKQHVEANFHSLPQTMLTLAQFVTLDNMNLIYKPLIDEDWRLALFFLLVLLVVSIVLTNLITGVIVNSAMEAAVEDREQMRNMEQLARKKEIMKELRSLFERLDVDGNGSLSWYEIETAQHEDRNYLGELVTTEDPMEIFAALDADGSGEVDIGEFCDIVWQIAVSGTNVEMRKLEKSVTRIESQVKDVEVATDEMRTHLESILKLLRAQTDASSHSFLRSESLGFSAAAALSKAEIQREVNLTEPYSASDGTGSAALDDEIAAVETATIGGASVQTTSPWGAEFAQGVEKSRAPFTPYRQSGSDLEAGDGAAASSDASMPRWASAIISELQHLRLDIHRLQAYPKRGHVGAHKATPDPEIQRIVNERRRASATKVKLNSREGSSESKFSSSNGHKSRSKEFDEAAPKLSQGHRHSPILGGVGHDRFHSGHSGGRNPRKATFNLDEGVGSAGGWSHKEVTYGSARPEPPGMERDLERRSNGDAKPAVSPVGEAAADCNRKESSSSSATKSVQPGVSEATSLSTCSSAKPPPSSGYGSSVSWQELDMRIAATLARGQESLPPVESNSRSSSQESSTEKPAWKSSVRGLHHGLDRSSHLAGELRVHAVL